MTVLISEVYEAFRIAGVPEGATRKAAEAMSSETAATKSDVVALRDELRERFARLDKEILLIKWMLGLVIAAEVLPLFRSIIH